MWIDTHAHLYNLTNSGLKETVDEAASNSVQTIVNTATDLATAGKVLQQSDLHTNLFSVVGISPFDIAGVQDSLESDLSALIENDSVIGIGEIGLDHSNPRYPPLVEQEPVFERQLSFGVEHDLPVVIHSRGAEDVALEFCREQSVEKALFHCFTGERHSLTTLIDYDYYVSFSGIVTFKNSPLVPLVKETPLNRIMIETDSPYLAPVPHRGRPNKPAWVSIIGETIARVKEISPEEVAEALQENFCRLFSVTL